MNSGNVSLFPEYHGYEKAKNEVVNLTEDDQYNEIIKTYLGYLTNGTAKNLLGHSLSQMLKQKVRMFASKTDMISKFNTKLESMVDQISNNVMEKIKFKDLCA